MSKYAKGKKILALLVKGDDLMEQDDLFEAQELMTEFLLEIATDEMMTKDLVKSFPWLYTAKKG